MIFERFNLLYFILAFSVGLFVCYITNPKPEIVVKFPSPQNSGKIIYKDKADTCYKFNATKTACPTDTSLIKSQPVTEDFRPAQPNSKEKQNDPFSIDAAFDDMNGMD